MNAEVVLNETSMTTQSVTTPSVTNGTVSSGVRRPSALGSESWNTLIPIGHGKGIKVCRHQRKLYVNICDYITTHVGCMYASRRGILLTPDEWKQLKSSVKDIDQQIKDYLKTI